jgi:hypothetical protein
MRGVVGWPEFHFPAKGGVKVNQEEGGQQLRAWSLFWDEIAVPDTQMVVGMRSPEAQFLAAEGLLRYYPIKTVAGDLSKQLLGARSDLFTQLEDQKAGMWAIGATEAEDDAVIPVPYGGRALRLKLLAALPVPTREVPLEEVVRFRSQRQAEREALMSYIDDVYLEVVDSTGDKPLAQVNAVAKLASAARDHLEAVRGAGFRFNLMDLISDFNLVPAISTLVGTAGGSAIFGHEWPTAVGNSLIAGGSLTVGQTISGLRRSSQAKTPFRYLSAIRDELHGPEWSDKRESRQLR